MKPWTRIEPTTICKVDRRVMVLKTFLDSQDRKVVYGTMHAEDQEFASVIAITNDGKVLVARQFRAGPEKIMDELPGGFVDSGEDPETAVRRELLEETGHAVGKLEYLGPHAKDAFMNATWHYFLATGCTQQNADLQLDEYEEIEVSLIPISQLLHNATHNKMTDAVAVLMAYEKLKKLEEAHD